jgi:hypothetical protein
MAAGAGIVVTNISVVRGTPIDVSVSQMTAATNAGINTADNDFFTITTPANDQKIVILVNNGTGATITAYIKNGGMWASVGDSATQTIVTGKTYAWTIDSAKYKTAAGTIIVMLTNANAVALSASAKANVTCLLLG